ncbi:TetR/AcrR family transcriptional regulator [Sulfitobacter pseudonitzschiae]|uniref:TetR/AcrR family transcriptional regulator n=2 Tax=Pseudosulfitobacter pseudonitzschiae TaxID=1402135 RepID=A0A9Q2RX35_9RHOB|nr:TetR/AcrR family transcriptional regulator [Pseudosulfitobacter pseudonitzschiae]
MAKDGVTKRKRGRPPGSAKGAEGLASREMIVDLACEAARAQSIDEISFVNLAKELGVRPGALHYHIGTKDDLASAILNRFYKELLARLDADPEFDDWREQIGRFARTLMSCERDHRGAAEHIQTHAKFRIFQKIQDGETDYGAIYLNRAFSMFRDAGFDAQTTAIFYHMLALHCLSTATSATSRLEPSAHEAFLSGRADAYPPGDMPGLDFALRAFARIRSDEVFERGVNALIDHFAPLRKSEA